MAELAVNLLSSVIAGTAVWVLAWLRRRRRSERTRRFLGITAGGRALLVVPRHVSSPNPWSVNQHDTAAIVELAALVMASGGRTDLVGNDHLPGGLGGVSEFCVGGPLSNERTATHLRLLVPGVQAATTAAEGADVTLTVGGVPYGMDADTRYAVVIKLFGPQGGAPVFVVCGQTGRSNHAAARYLAANHRELVSRYGPDGRFALLLRLRGIAAYGADGLDSVTDVTEAAFAVPAAAVT